MSMDDIANRCGEWLRGTGPESDIVMSSRIRLARNLADYPFIRRCNDIDKANIESTVRERIVANTDLSSLSFINVLTPFGCIPKWRPNASAAQTQRRY